jgi:3-methylcrotonyl-CoA carboxylase alpha subunit
LEAGVAEWTVDPRADGTWRIGREDGRSRVAHAVTDAEGTLWVQIEGEVVAIADESASRPRARVHGHATLDAPMPAQVTAVLVVPGDVVEAGATLVVLEAMKMELPLKAPAAGRVQAVHCAAGDRVTPGRVLVDLEAPGDAP